MVRRISICLLMLLLPFVLFGASGKIAGTVVDESTGEPLAGVNIILEDAPYAMGAATNQDGYYVIMNVPPGTYTVRATYMGRKDVVISNVKVTSNLTTELDFEMEEKVIEGQVVEVIARRKLIDKDATSSVSITTSEELESIPVRGTQDIIQNMAGVVVQDGNVHIRGGRADEVGYYVEGAAAVNPMNNTNAVAVINEALEEMQVFSSGFTAEMGGANAGVIKQEFKTGGKKFNGSLDWQQDGFGNPEEGDQFMNTYTYGHKIGVLTLGGPLLSNKIRFFVAGEYEDEMDGERRWSEGYEFGTGDTVTSHGQQYVDILVDRNPYNQAFGFDTVSFAYPDGFTPKNEETRYTLNGTVVLDLPVKIRLGGAYTYQKYGISDQPMLDIMNDRNPYNVNKSLLLNAKATMVTGKNSYLDLRFNHFDRSLERGDSWFDHDWKKYYDSTAVAEHGVTYRNAWQPMFDYSINGFPMERNGDPNNRYFIQSLGYNGMAADYVGQMGQHHQIKAGTELRRWTCRFFDISPSVMALTAPTEVGQRIGITSYGSEENVPDAEWFNEGRVNAYGYDIYGNEIDDKKYYIDQDDTVYVDGPKRPTEFAAYFHDKIEFNDLIINAGVRFDYFDTDDKELKDPTNPPVNEETGLIKEKAWQKKDPETFISPRLGFSFPATDRSVFYMNYGQFVQMPSLNNIYTGTYSLSRQIYQGGYYYINPIGFGLGPIHTTSYEVGFRQQIADNAALDVTGFYKNEKGKIQVTKQNVDPNSVVPIAYERFVNSDFATTKGLEFRLTLRRVKRISGNLNYTLTQAEGTASNSTSYHGAIYRDTQKPTTINPLDYSQTHTGSVNLNYQFGKNDGGAILQQSGVNLLMQFSSGHPFTKVYVPAGGQVSPYNAGVDYMFDTRSREAVEPIGASKTPWTFVTDLNVYKRFDLTGKMRAIVYMRVRNLFNRKNILNVYQMTGSPVDDGFINNETRSESVINSYGGQQYVDMYKAININNSQAYWDIVGEEIFGTPRQIFFGIKFEF